MGKANPPKNRHLLTPMPPPSGVRRSEAATGHTFHGLTLTAKGLGTATREMSEAQPQVMASGSRRRCQYCGVTNFTRSTDPDAGDCPPNRRSACKRRQGENLDDGLTADGREPDPGGPIDLPYPTDTSPPQEEAMTTQKSIILADMRENLAPQRPWGNTQGVLGTSGDISKRTGITPHDVTHALYDMQKQGLVTFKSADKAHASGGRGALTHLRLTMKGRNAPLSNGETTATPPNDEEPKIVRGPVADVEGYLNDRSGYREAQANTVADTVAETVAGLLIEAYSSVALDGETQVAEGWTEEKIDALADEFTEKRYAITTEDEDEAVAYAEARRAEEALGAVNEGLIAKLAALEGGDLEGRFPILHELVTRESNARKTQEAAYLLRLAGQHTLADMALEAGRVTFQPWEQEVVELLQLLQSEHDA